MSLQRVGISLEDELLKKFDEHMLNKGYTNRSEAVRDIIRKNLIEGVVINDKNVNVFGTLTIIFNHHSSEVNKRLTQLQHHNVEQIISTTHIHVDEDMCLEVLLLKGMGGTIEELANSIMAIKGVLHGGLVITGSIIG